MSANSKIEWTDHTFNAWWGCTAVSPACDHCYAESFAKRVGYSDNGSKFPIWGKDAGRRFFGDKHWAEPLKWDREAAKATQRSRVFCGSMCDVMEEYNGDGHLVKETIEESRRWLYRLIERTPNLDWLLLTKRPQNFRRFLPESWLNTPRPNVWGMTTVEANAYRWRIDALIETPFAVRALSCEPLLQELKIEQQLYTGGIHQVICGGESGHGARPMHPDWARSLRDQCQRAGVAFFFKQWGDWQNGSGLNPGNDRVMLNDGMVLGMDLADANYEVRSNWADYQSTVISKVGKKAAGRLLDGRTWDELPAGGRMSEYEREWTPDEPETANALAVSGPEASSDPHGCPAIAEASRSLGEPMCSACGHHKHISGRCVVKIPKAENEPAWLGDRCKCVEGKR